MEEIGKGEGPQRDFCNSFSESKFMQRLFSTACTELVQSLDNRRAHKSRRSGRATTGLGWW